MGSAMFFSFFKEHGKGKVCLLAKGPIRSELNCSMKRLGVLLLPLDGMLVHRRSTPSIKFAGTHLYTWVKRGTVRVKYNKNYLTWAILVSIGIKRKQRLQTFA